MGNNFQGLETLEAWKQAKGFAVRVCREVLPLLPGDEKWVLGQQMRRSVQSIPVNIAEGHGRFYNQETICFCYFARGSLSETYTQLAIAAELGYLPEKLQSDLSTQMDNLHKIIHGYIGYLKRSKIGEGEPGANYSTYEDPPTYLYEGIEDNDPSEDISS
jgi:four helix bundle protein